MAPPLEVYLSMTHRVRLISKETKVLMFFLFFAEAIPVNCPVSFS
jgi:hypothetical protein